MKYKAYRFESVYELRDFLNDNEINPNNIVGIYREHKYTDQGFFDLLYVEQTELQKANDKAAVLKEEK